MEFTNEIENLKKNFDYERNDLLQVKLYKLEYKIIEGDNKAIR